MSLNFKGEKINDMVEAALAALADSPSYTTDNNLHAAVTVLAQAIQELNNYVNTEDDREPTTVDDVLSSR